MIRNRVAIITGGASGVGRYTAHGLAKEGAKVVIADVDTERLERTRGELQGLVPDVMAATTNVRNEEQVRSLMAKVADRFGRIDILVNAAAIVPHFSWGIPRWAAIGDMDKSFWDSVIETNLGGIFLCSRYVLPYMRESGSGHIVNFNGGGNVKTTGTCAYVVTKEGVRAFSQYVAEEERERNICVITVAPDGAIATDEAPEEARRRLPGTESLGNRIILAAQADMELSGHLVNLKDGNLNVIE